MSVNLILGPAGSGKTHRCLQKVKTLLKQAPEGDCLLFIAPRQSTYLIERQLLGLGVVGFTRLEILPFDRLALRILEALGKPAHDLLSEEGRVMVLRALLLQNEKQLKAFQTFARSPGFSTQLSKVLRELQRSGTAPEQLHALSVSGPTSELLSGKLHDLALLLKAYHQWVAGHGLQDQDELLIRAAAELAAARKSSRPLPKFGGLWMDGFAEMTSPEMNLLVELLPLCADSTLAFCLDATPGKEDSSDTETSIWRLTQKTLGQLQARIKELGLKHEFVRLPAEGESHPRFQSAPALHSLAAHWNLAKPPQAGVKDGLNFVECTDPEAEAQLAARLIGDHVRNHQGRYREVSVIVRRMEDYAEVLSRAFRRHGIPFFIDHREPMGHHPLAELTRSALCMAARQWSHEDWMATLKTGLVVDNPLLVDKLENVTLAKGLRGDAWLDVNAYKVIADLTADAMGLLKAPILAFQEFRKTMSGSLDGRTLAQALSDLWTALKVPQTLQQWEAEVEKMEIPIRYQTLHRTAWEQMTKWNESLALAFAEPKLGAQDWLPIVEAGLANLSLGSIPPSLDQVFIGAIDRARQPEVKLAIVLGLNAGVFPAPPPAPVLLNRAERVAILSQKDLGLNWDPIELTAREQYYAYLACTRASERLCLNWSRLGLDGKRLTRSASVEKLLAFAGHQSGEEPVSSDCLQFDGKLKSFNGHFKPESASSWPELLECPQWHLALPANHEKSPRIGVAKISVDELGGQLTPAKGEATRRLNKTALAGLYPAGVIKSSVSALEKFANCPFQYFAAEQLRLKEREEFTADQATMGTLLHAILKRFHDHTLNEKKQPWRAWDADAAAKKVIDLGDEILKMEQFAPQRKDPLIEWESLRRIRGLGTVVKQIIDWFKTNSFDPVFAEFKFREGADHHGEPADGAPWTIDLPSDKKLIVQGSIDRLDAHRLEDGRVLVAVFDYKTGGRSFNKAKLQNGFELQLLGYLAFAVESAELKKKLIERLPIKDSADSKLVAAGAFYIPLSPKIPGLKADDDAAARHKKQLESLTHHGRADDAWRQDFDTSAEKHGNSWKDSLQFKNHQKSENFLAKADFLALVKNTKDFIKEHTESILSGKIGVEPARFGTQKTACEFCPYLPLCRFEPVFGDFRTVVYRKPEKSSEPTIAIKPKKSKK
jgi:ATP-dependent helicase/nuclease subunit B